jgi:hypothetical protein
MKLAGIVLIIVGAIFLVYQGVTYTTIKKDVDLGPLQVQHQEQHSIPFPPIIGAVCIAGGVAALALGARNNY